MLLLGLAVKEKNAAWDDRIGVRIRIWTIVLQTVSHGVREEGSPRRELWEKIRHFPVRGDRIPRIVFRRYAAPISNPPTHG